MRLPLPLASNANPTFLLFATLAILFQITSISKAEDPTFFSCYDSANYTSGTQFETNLNHTFSSLYQNTPLTRFNTTVYGEYPNRVYGLVQCRGDAKQVECRNCVNTSTTEIVRRCPHRKEGSIRYWGCVLRYADWEFFGQIDGKSPKIELYPVDNVTDVTLFNEKVGGLMDNLSTAAASSPSKFAIGRTSSVNYFQYVYGMLQCTSDLSYNDCYTCLRSIISDIPNCCNWRSGGNVYTVSCFLRYDSYPIYDLLSPPPPSPTQASPPLPLPVVRGGGTTTTNTTHGKGNGKVTLIITGSLVIPVVSVAILVIAVRVWWLRRNLRKENGTRKMGAVNSLLFDLRTLKVATGGFSDSNKIGQGGSGTVYKGKLLDGREIAVKRLSRNSPQSSEEMKTEILLVAKLQHRNLLRLLGCCLEEQEKLLVYEYLPNLSLDHYLFHHIKRLILDWERRHKIIEGIARGLLYLHQDSQLRIIHRDLKASNVLLDEEMNPKISDFGLARLFQQDQTHDQTKQIAGTYGYMPPEYAIHGQFSTKSDVYSFGVLVLEIVTGRRCSTFCKSSNHSTNLLSFVWHHWANGTATELLDRTLRQPFPKHEVVRCIHIGLLCVQEDPSDRPAMSTVVLMLTSHSISLSVPSQPAFFIWSTTETDDLPTNSDAGDLGQSNSYASEPGQQAQHSKNEVTLSELDPR